MTNGMDALAFPVRPAVVGRYLGQLALMLALLTTAPLGVAAVAGEIGLAIRFAVIIAGLAGIGLLTRRLPEPARIQTNEALVVVSLAFVIAPLLAAWPLSADGLAFADALFEAVSAITTTGLSTAGSLESRSTGFLFARAWMQWYGGLGIAVLSVALLMGPHAAARRLIVNSSDPENLATTTRIQARQVLSVYIGLTLLGTVML